VKSKSNKTLLLFTQSFPFTQAAEQTFLRNEVEYLFDSFSKVIIVPEYAEGDRVKINEEILFDKSLFYYIKQKQQQNKLYKLLLGFSFRLILSELKNRPDIFLSPKKIKRLLSAGYKIKLVKEWFNKHYKESKNSILYTYWFTPTTLGLLNGKAKVITRAHGIDLYEERHNDYIPLRNYALSQIERVCCVSQAGVDYLTQKYPKDKEKYSLNRIGVKNSKNSFQREKPTKEFIIVSCSGLIRLKRVDLILKGVIEFAKRNNELKIEYFHFGDGEEMKKITKIISDNRAPNLQINFKGNTENSQILDFYATNHIDVFINASTTEGIPVSIMEAQSFGIPFIGTNVGGIPELLNGKNGIIISENPTVEEIADAVDNINNLADAAIISMRENSYKNWHNRFNADLNFKKFAEEIFKL